MSWLRDIAALQSESPNWEEGCHRIASERSTVEMMFKEMGDNNHLYCQPNGARLASCSIATPGISSRMFPFATLVSKKEREVVPPLCCLEPAGRAYTALPHHQCVYDSFPSGINIELTKDIFSTLEAVERCAIPIGFVTMRHNHSIEPLVSFLRDPRAVCPLQVRPRPERTQGAGATQRQRGWGWRARAR